MNQEAFKRHKTAVELVKLRKKESELEAILIKLVRIPESTATERERLRSEITTTRSEIEKMSKKLTKMLSGKVQKKI